MAEKVAELGIDMLPGHIYFLDEEGDVSCQALREPGAKPVKVRRLGLARSPGFLYFVDKGDLWRAPIGGR